ncbi:hypothetical protein BHM03_00053043 [Ensete ventricosum]|nr:hypothetical protein BHM03_00053043 [Ensete ventricosum]
MPSSSIATVSSFLPSSSSSSLSLSPSPPLLSSDFFPLDSSPSTFLTLVLSSFPGVIWKGDKLIEGVPHALRALRSLSLVDRNQDSQLTNIVSVCRQGKKLVFVTNNSTKSRKQYSRKFTSLGVDVSEVRVFL